MKRAAEQFEEEYAPDCNDCGVTTELRGFQEKGTGNGYLVQWVCPECDPERVRLTVGIPEGYEVVPAGPEDPDQLTLEQVLTDGGITGPTHEFLLDADRPERPLEVAATIREHVDGLPDTKALWAPSDVLGVGEVLEYGPLVLMTGAWPQPSWYNGSKVKRYVNPSYVHAKKYSDLRETCECGRVNYGYGVGNQMETGAIRAHDDTCTPESQRAAKGRLWVRRVAWLKKAALLWLRQPVAKRRLGFESNQQASRLIKELPDTYFDWYGRGMLKAATTMTILRGWGVDAQLIADAYGTTRQTVYTYKAHCHEPTVREVAPRAFEDHRRKGAAGNSFS